MGCKMNMFVVRKSVIVRVVKSFFMITLCAIGTLIHGKAADDKSGKKQNQSVAQAKSIKKSPVSDIQVKRVYVHEGNLSRKIVLQFASNPVVTYTPESLDENKRDENGLMRMTFFMPHACVDQSNKEALAMLSGMHTHDYGLAFKEMVKPLKGIKCVVLFNPDKVGFEYKTYTSITGDKGVIFQFYYQDTLRKMSESNNIRMQASLQLKRSALIKKK